MGAGAQQQRYRAAANAGSAMLTAELSRLNTDLLVVPVPLAGGCCS